MSFPSSLSIRASTALCLFACVAVCRAATNYWVGAAGSDWFNTNNWSALAVPAEGDAVIITNAGSGVLLSNSTPFLASLALTNKTLTFTNWGTVLAAAEVTIWSNGVLTLPGPFTTNQMSNQIYIICSNFTLYPGGSINVNGKGYARGPTPNLSYAYGPGCGYTYYNGGSGGGHGGTGGRTYQGAGGGVENDTVSAPAIPGSGGAPKQNFDTGGDGGGLVTIQASNGLVTINGTITANGNNTFGAGGGGGGAGGGIHVNCATFGGSATGLLSAAGGSSDSFGGGGGGGRIAIVYQNLARPVGIRLSAESGTGANNNVGHPSAARKGTLYFPDEVLFNARIEDAGGALRGLWGTVQIGATWTNWSTNSLVITNASLSFSDFSLSFASNLTIHSGGSLIFRGGTLSCANDLLLTNGGVLNIVSQPTNAVASEYGALVWVGGTLSIATNSWVYPYADYTNGGAPLFQVRDLVVEAGGGINASGKGFWRGSGPGKGVYYFNYGSGGGHGGQGGMTQNGQAGGGPNDSTNVPTLPGSGGGDGNSAVDWAIAAHGGGVVAVQASGKATINGILNANGNACYSTSGGGGGGSICVQCGSFEGNTQGLLSAAGGNATSGGGGGGGRIAILVGLTDADKTRVKAGNTDRLIVTNEHKYFSGAFSVTNGAGYTNIGPNAAQPGTAWFITRQFGGMMIIAQ